MLAVGLVAGCGDEEPAKDVTIYPDFLPWSDYNPSSCTASTCSGCCLGSSCLGGTSTSACGYGGNTCQPCKAKETCQAGACTAASTCDSTSCANGCCDSTGQCQKGTSTSACGTAGASCATCKSGESCVGGKCKTKGTGLYQVILSKAEIVSYSCDAFGGKCDLYIKLTVGSITATSTTKDNDDKPIWEETLLTATESDITTKFEAVVYDDDWPFDEYIGTCKPTVTTKELSAGSVEAECGNYTSMGFLKTCKVTFKFKVV